MMVIQTIMMVEIVHELLSQDGLVILVLHLLVINVEIA